MDKFVALQNIEHFRRLIAAEIDGAELQKLRGLLAEQEAKLAAIERRAKAATRRRAAIPASVSAPRQPTFWLPR
jgi:hypothetical protein